jgi:hypothetical protein
MVYAPRNVGGELIASLRGAAIANPTSWAQTCEGCQHGLSQSGRYALTFLQGSGGRQRSSSEVSDRRRSGAHTSTRPEATYNRLDEGHRVGVYTW